MNPDRIIPRGSRSAVVLLAVVAAIGLWRLSSAQLTVIPSLPHYRLLSTTHQSLHHAVGLLRLHDLDGGGMPDVALVVTPVAAIVAEIVVLSTEDGSEIIRRSAPNGGDFWSIANYVDTNGDGIDEVLSCSLDSANISFSLHDGSDLNVLSTSIVSSFGLDDWTTIPDIDADGFPDVVLVKGAGTFTSTSGPGGIVIFNPMTGQVVYSSAPIVSGLSGSIRVNSLGDLNGNGDHEVGIVFHSPANPGLPSAQLGIFDCSTVGLTMRGSVSFSFTATTRISSPIIIDVDGDGIRELALRNSVGPGNNFNIISGADLSLVGTLPAAGNLAYEFSGDVTTIDDIDGDNINEVVTIGSFQGGATGLWELGALVYSGRTLAPTFRLGGSTGSFIGGGRSPMKGIIDLGDLNGDGFPEIAVKDIAPLSATGLSSGVSLVDIYSGTGVFHPLVGSGTVQDQLGNKVTVLRTQVGTNTPSSGGAARTVLAEVGDVVKLFVERPPLHAFVTARFAIFAQIGEGPFSSAYALPSGVGAMSIPTSLTHSGDPSLILVSSSFNGLSGLVPTVPAFHVAPGTLAANLGAIPFPATVVFQCVIEDTNHAGLPLSISNALRLIVD